jgi:hypothetical protein
MKKHKLKKKLEIYKRAFRYSSFADAEEVGNSPLWKEYCALFIENPNVESYIEWLCNRVIELRQAIVEMSLAFSLNKAGITDTHSQDSPEFRDDQRTPIPFSKR